MPAPQSSKIRTPSPAEALTSHPQSYTNHTTLHHTPSFDFDPGYFFQTPGWKRFSVTLSILFSAITLCTGAVAQLANLDVQTTRVLLVTGIVVNAISVTLSALTSLNWQTPQVQERQFLERMLGVMHVSADGRVGFKHAAREIREVWQGGKV